MDITWFKLNANFDKDDRITLVESERNGSVAIYHYIKLNCIAARCNQQGGVFITDDRPHTVKTLAKQWHCGEEKVRKMIDMLTCAGLLEVIDGVIYISDWSMVQSADRLEEIRQNARLRKQKSRARQAENKEAMSRDGDKNVTQRHALEEEEEEEKETETEGEGEGEGEDEKTVKDLIAHFNASTAFPKIKILSSIQKEAVMNAVKEFGLEQLKQCFDKASASEFLNGKNSKGWIANFDWLINPENVAKVLNGNYDSVFGDERNDTCSSFSIDEFYEAALARGLGDMPD